VSSYSRNAFTRGAPCLCLVRCPLYTFAAATCHSASHLRNRSSLGPSLRPRRASQDISPVPPPAPARGVPDARHSLSPSSLRRRGMTARIFGTEGQHCSDGLLLHDKTHITQVALVFPSNQHCENSPVWPKLRASRNRQPGRTWTGLLKTSFPNRPTGREEGCRSRPRGAAAGLKRIKWMIDDGVHVKNGWKDVTDDPNNKSSRTKLIFLKVQGQI
jgi:hypothetical protein